MESPPLSNLEAVAQFFDVSATRLGFDADGFAKVLAAAGTLFAPLCAGVALQVNSVPQPHQPPFVFNTIPERESGTDMTGDFDARYHLNLGGKSARMSLGPNHLIAMERSLRGFTRTERSPQSGATFEDLVSSINFSRSVALSHGSTIIRERLQSTYCPDVQQALCSTCTLKLVHRQGVWYENEGSEDCR